MSGNRKNGSRKRKQRKQRAAPQSKLKQRLSALEGTLSEGIDTLILEVRRIDGNIQILAGGLEDIDDNAATLRKLMVDKGVFTNEEFDAQKQEIVDIRAKAREEAARKLKEAEEALAKAAQEAADQADEEVDPLQPDAELIDMQQKAIKAGADYGIPDGAFTFGGS